MKRKIILICLLTGLTISLQGQAPRVLSDTTVKTTPKEIETLRYIYLTFDDGPLPGSQHIDSIVLAEKLNINVFLVGRNIANSTLLRSYRELYGQNPYIDQYNHSYSHANGKYKEYYNNPQHVLEDIRLNDSVCRLQYKVVRLPGRNMWRVGDRKRDDVRSGSTSADLLAANGYKVVGWDLEWRHDPKTGYPIQSVDDLVASIEALLNDERCFTPGHVVILMHDEMFRKNWEGNELKQLIERLKNETGYIFGHMSSYPDE